MRKLIAILVSLSILGLIYWQIDFDRVIAVLGNCNGPWLAVAIAMVVPLTLVTAWRLALLVPKGQVRLGEALDLTLMAGVLNMVLPSKMGDLAKGYAIAERGHMPGAAAFSLVVFEKGMDVLSLLMWCVFALIVIPTQAWITLSAGAIMAGVTIVGGLALSSRAFGGWMFGLLSRLAPAKMAVKIDKLRGAWDEILVSFWSRKGRAAALILVSLALWFLHLVQIWLFVFALNISVPLMETIARAALAIFVGLLPFTFAGVGTRDAALIVFFQPFMPAAAAAALGLLCTLRYLLPAVAGLPFLGRYLVLVGRKPRTAAGD